MKRQGQASNSSGLGRIAPCRIQIRQGATIVQSQEDDGAECQSWSNRAIKNDPDKGVEEIYREIPLSTLDGCRQMDALSHQYFISIVKEGLKIDKD